jgi:hypothetical protein
MSPFGVRELAKLAPAFGPWLYPQRQLAAALECSAGKWTVRPGQQALMGCGEIRQ